MKEHTLEVPQVNSTHTICPFCGGDGQQNDTFTEDAIVWIEYCCDTCDGTWTVDFQPTKLCIDPDDVGRLNLKVQTLVMTEELFVKHRYTIIGTDETRLTLLGNSRKIQVVTLWNLLERWHSTLQPLGVVVAEHVWPVDMDEDEVDATFQFRDEASCHAAWLRAFTKVQTSGEKNVLYDHS
ncbi:MAG TPA: hypothetical protein VGN17_25500 [Bryobacteraceae bacterium]|jgi:hypothetical protein